MFHISDCFRRNPGIMGERRRYSVLVPFFRTKNGWELVFEKRAQMISQPGEISFPGGGVEKDETPKRGAIRETCEELGVTPGQVQLWGPLDTIVGYDGMVLHSYAGELEISSLDELEPNPAEVAEVFSVPLDFFMEQKPDVYHLPLETRETDDFPYDLIPGGRDYPWRRGYNKVRFYKPEEAVIWGLTARIIENMVEIVKAYEKNLP